MGHYYLFEDLKLLSPAGSESDSSDSDSLLHHAMGTIPSTQTVQMLSVVDDYRKTRIQLVNDLKGIEKNPLVFWRKTPLGLKPLQSLIKMLFVGVSASGLAEGIASRWSLSKTKVRASLRPSLLIESTIIDTNYELFAPIEHFVFLVEENYEKKEKRDRKSVV